MEQTGQITRRLWQHFVEQAARVWNLSPRLMLGLYALPFFVALSGVIAALLGKDAYKWFTEEDGFAENTQVIFLCGSLVLCIIIARQLFQGGDTKMALIYGLLGAAFFFLIGEEVSWGERIFGWQTPQSYAAINKQGETNIHNIYGLRFAFKWAKVCIAAYGAFGYVVIRRAAILRRYQKMISLLVPHYTLAPYFALPFVWGIYANLIPPPERLYFVVSEYSEVMELVLYIGFFLFMVFQMMTIRAMKADSRPFVASAVNSQ